MDASEVLDLLGPPDAVAAARLDLVFWLGQLEIMQERLENTCITDAEALDLAADDLESTENYVASACRRLHAAELVRLQPAARMGGLQ